MSAHSAEHRAKLSASLKKRWASGERKVAVDSRALQSESQKATYAAGRKPVSLSSQEAKRRRALADEEKIAAFLRKTAQERIGVPNPPGPSARGVEHWKARYWEILSPDRQTFRFVNLSEFVREHPGLFDARDIEWQGSWCRATKRISQLFASKNAPLSWKGWRPIKSADK